MKGTTGRIGLVPPEFVGNISRDVARLRVNHDHCPAYWFQMLQSPLAQRTLEQAAVGSTRQELSIGALRMLTFRFPGRHEQQRIAAALADADELIAALKGMIEKRRGIKQGVMHELLLGRRRLPGYSVPWQPRSLGEMLRYEQPRRYIVQSATQLPTGRTPVLTAGKTFVLGFTNDVFGLFTKHPVIIFDDFTTDSKFVDFDFKVKSSAVKLLSAQDDVDLRFIYERMLLIAFPCGDHKRYWISEYSKQELEVPCVDEQRAIARVLADADAEIDLLQRRLAKARDIKHGMMQELFTGRTLLPADEAAA